MSYKIEYETNYKLIRPFIKRSKSRLYEMHYNKRCVSIEVPANSSTDVGLNMTQ